MKTFRIIYNVRNSENRKDAERSQIGTLPDAIDSYCPDADLVVCVDPGRFPLNICRDMYGFHENLLDVMYAVAFDRRCDNVGYPDVLIPDRPEQRSYGIMLTEQQSPSILVFIAEYDFVYFQTRSLATQGIIALADDITTPLAVPKRDVIAECTSFLIRYLDDLTCQMPYVKDFADYKEYVEKIEAMRVRVISGKESS